MRIISLTIVSIVLQLSVARMRNALLLGSKRGISATTAAGAPAYFLMKNEPDSYSIYDLAKDKANICEWEGVRNYTARKIISQMNVGDRAFFYHSNAKSATGIAGTVEICTAPYPDPTAIDESSKYFCKKSFDKGESQWSCVDVRLIEGIA